MNNRPDSPTSNPAGRICPGSAPWILPVALAAALGISNGPAVGIGVGAAMALLLVLMNRR
jgi:hypothetical protein